MKGVYCTGNDHNNIKLCHKYLTHKLKASGIYNNIEDKGIGMFHCLSCLLKEEPLQVTARPVYVPVSASSEPFRVVTYLS